MIDIERDLVDVHVGGLHRELAAVLGSQFVGLSTNGTETIRLHITNDALNEVDRAVVETQIDKVISAHDPIAIRAKFADAHKLAIDEAVASGDLSAFSLADDVRDVLQALISRIVKLETEVKQAKDHSHEN